VPIDRLSLGWIRTRLVEKYSERRAGLRLPAACSLLALAIALAAALAGSIAYERDGGLGLAAASVAALTCGLSAMAALVLAGSLAGTRWGVHGILAASFLRFAAPLTVVIASVAIKGPLSRGGLAGYMVIFFLLALTVETLLLVGVLRSVTTNGNRMAWREP
jgi:hypothetical protein